jgi:hypothetical protein
MHAKLPNSSVLVLVLVLVLEIEIDIEIDIVPEIETAPPKCLRSSG